MSERSASYSSIITFSGSVCSTTRIAPTAQSRNSTVRALPFHVLQVSVVNYVAASHHCKDLIEPGAAHRSALVMHVPVLPPRQIQHGHPIAIRVLKKKKKCRNWADDPIGWHNFATRQGEHCTKYILTASTATKRRPPGTTTRSQRPGGKPFLQR